MSNRKDGKPRIGITEEWPKDMQGTFKYDKPRVQEGYAVPTSIIHSQPRDGKDPAGLWNPPQN